MKIHEYQSRKLLGDAGVPVPPAEVVETVEQAVAAYEKIHGKVVVKAQVFAGGRGKAGFVKLCDNAEQVRQAAEFMLSNKMVSKQTGPEGIAVRKLLIAAAVVRIGQEVTTSTWSIAGLTITAEMDQRKAAANAIKIPTRGDSRSAAGVTTRPRVTPVTR